MRKHRTRSDLREFSIPAVVIKSVLGTRPGRDKEVQQSIIIVVSPGGGIALASNPFVQSYGTGQDARERAVPVIMIQTIKRVRRRANDEQIHEPVIVVI